MPRAAKEKKPAAPEWSKEEAAKKGPKGLSLTNGQGNQDWGHTKRPRKGLSAMTPPKSRGKKCAMVNKELAVEALSAFNKMFNK